MCWRRDRSTHTKVHMYAIDGVIISNKAKYLQNGLNVTQRIADQSGIEFSFDAGKSEVIVFGDTRNYPYEWNLMGER